MFRTAWLKKCLFEGAKGQKNNAFKKIKNK